MLSCAGLNISFIGKDIELTMEFYNVCLEGSATEFYKGNAI